MSVEEVIRVVRVKFLEDLCFLDQIFGRETWNRMAMNIVDDLLTPPKKEEEINRKNEPKNNDNSSFFDTRFGMKQIQNIQYTTPGTGSRFSNNHAKNSPQTSSPWRRRTVTKSSAWLMGETFPTLTNERRNQRPKRRLNRFTLPVVQGDVTLYMFVSMPGSLWESDSH